jgi:hypothetical protein
MKKQTVIVLALSAIIATGCARTPSNVHVLSTTDCGAKWEKLDIGSSVPKHTGNPCGYNLALPNWPMAGDAKFKTQFAKKVLSSATLSYTYVITNPIAFINEARYLGKMGGNLEISAEATGDRYEMAENIIIDKIFREATTELTRNIDLVDANPAEIEDAIFKMAKDILEKKGVTISDLALIIESDEQTRLAIDAATAVRVYDAAGIGDIGKQVITARAGATQIKITTSPDARH